MPQRPPNEDRSITVAAAIVAALWISGFVAYDVGYFGSRLFVLPLEDSIWLGAWIVVPVALIAACAGLIQAASNPATKQPKQSRRRKGKR